MTLLEERFARVEDAADARQVRVLIKETGQVFNSAAQVGKYLGVDHSVVYHILRQTSEKQKQYHNLHFVYALDSQPTTDIVPRHVQSMNDLKRLIRYTHTWVHIPYNAMELSEIQTDLFVKLMIEDAVNSDGDLTIRRYDFGLSFLWLRRNATKG